MKRSFVGFFIFIFVFGCLSVFVLVLCSRVTVTCSRSEARCQVLVERGPGIVTEDETFPLASLERASVESHVDDEGTTLEGIALVRHGKAELLDGSSNVGHDGKVEWAETINTFLRDSSKDRLELARGVIWPAYIWCFLGLVGLIGVLSSKTRFVIDKDAGLFKIDVRGLFRSTQTYPLENIASVDVHQRDSDGTLVRAIRLCFKDGTAKALTGYSNVEDAEKIRLVAALNDAIQDEDAA